MNIRTVVLAFGVPVLSAASASAAPLVSIPEIQGRSDSSQLIDEIVRTTGVVTAKRRASQRTLFYVQDPVGDGDPNTSDAIVVVAPTANVNVGDVVSVEGRVGEWAEGRNNLTVTTISPGVLIKTGTVDLPVPVVLGAGGTVLPTEAIAGPGGAIELLETLEGMRVRIVDAQVVGPTNSFGEFWVVGAHGQGATGMNSFGGITSSPNDPNPERLQIQLGENADDFQVSVGEQISEIIGVLDYSFGNFEIVPSTMSPVAPGSVLPAPEVTVSTGDLTVGSYNVENLDAKLEQVQLLYAKRDQDDDFADGRFSTIARQIVETLHAPDIVALQEVQDDDGGEVSDVTTSGTTLQTLIDAIKAVDGTVVYEPLVMDPVDDAEGGQPGGNIRVAFLYRQDRVELETASLDRIEGDAFADTRLPLVATFTAGAQKLRVVNVHLSSKGGSDPTYGTVQPPADSTLAVRLGQAEAIKAYLAAEPDLPTVILGDFNSFYFEEPMQELAAPGADFVNLTEDADALERASYIFEGNSQALDHVLVSTDLGDRAELVTFHLNSVVPEEGQMSDHDPKLLVLRAPN